MPVDSLRSQCRPEVVGSHLLASRCQRLAVSGQRLPEFGQSPGFLRCANSPAMLSSPFRSPCVPPTGHSHLSKRRMYQTFISWIATQ